MILRLFGILAASFEVSLNEYLICCTVVDAGRMISYTTTFRESTVFFLRIEEDF